MTSSVRPVRAAAGETIAVLVAWAVVQWLAWEALGRLHVGGGALGHGHHHVSAVAGAAGGVLVILVAGRVARSDTWSRRQSVVYAVAAAVASLMAGLVHVSGDTSQGVIPVLALWVVISVVQALTAALTCVVWREAARVWAPGPVGRTLILRPVRRSIVPTHRRAPIVWSGSPLTSRAPPSPSHG